jgi:hypothetical protein
VCFTNTEKQKATRLKSDNQSRTVQRLQSGTRCHDPSADEFEFCSGTSRSMESSNLEGFARAIENSLVRRILRSRVRSEEVPIDGSTFPLRKLITVAVLQLELDKKEASRHLTHLSLMEPRTRMHHQPVSIMPYMAHTTVAILMLFQISTLFRHGVQLRQLIAFSITSVTCIALLNQPQPRELWAFCLALGYTIWNLLPGSFALFHLPSHPTFMRNLRIRDQTGKCIVCWDTRPLAELPCKHESCRDCLQLMGEYGQTACPLCRTPLFGARDWPVLAAMKTVVASMGVGTALCLVNAQFEIRRVHVLNSVVWMVASGFAVPVFWCVVVYIIVPNSEDWWCNGSGRFSSATTAVSVVSTVGAVVGVLWLGEGRFK